jgi:hypothetical protein
VQTGEDDRGGPPWGAGSAPLTSAALRFATLRQPPTAEGLPTNPWGILIVAKQRSKNNFPISG